MAALEIKRNDNKRYIFDTLTYGGAAQNLTGATVNFCMKSSPKNTGKRIAIKEEAEIVSEAAGTVKFQLLAEHTETAGKYLFEWEVTFGDDSVLTFPSGEWGELNILEDLG